MAAKNKKRTSTNTTETTINELKSGLRKLRFDNALGQLDDTSKIRKTKKAIARQLTLEKKDGHAT